METEEKVIKRSRKLLIASAAALLVGFLAIWASHLRTKASSERLHAELERELGTYQLPSSTPIGIGGKTWLLHDYARSRAAVLMNLMPNGKASFGNIHHNTQFPHRYVQLQAEAANLRRFLLDRPAREAAHLVKSYSGMNTWAALQISHLLRNHMVDRLEHGDFDAAAKTALTLIADAWWSTHLGSPDVQTGPTKILWRLLQHDDCGERELQDFADGLHRIWMNHGQRQFLLTPMAAIRHQGRSYRENPKLSSPDWRNIKEGLLLVDMVQVERALQASWNRLQFRVWDSYDRETMQLERLAINVRAWNQGLADGNLTLAVSNATIQHKSIPMPPKRHLPGHFSSRRINDVTDQNATTLRIAVSREALRRMVLTVVALKRYKLQHGVFPESLSNLVPDFLDEIHIDPMDGNPLRYGKISPDDFTLYSVGLNGTDDDGTVSPNETASTANWFEGIDWIWPRHASRPDTIDHAIRDRQSEQENP